MRVVKSIFVIAAMAGFPAYAADMELRDTIAPAQYATAFTWTGVYVGGSIGLGKIVDYDGLLDLNLRGRNDTVSAHAGYMHQVGNLVFGAEYEYTQYDMEFLVQPIDLPSRIYVTESHSIFGRVGLAMDRFQVYGVAGFAHYTIDSPVVPSFPITDWKPVVGAGVDYAVNDHVILGGRYTYGWYDDFADRPYSGYLEHYSARMSMKF